jgi:hypothetical protein
MAQPLWTPPPPNQPLLDVITQVGLTTKEMNQMLKDGAAEVERLVPKLLEQHTTGGSVKAAQLLLVQRELKAVQSALWGDLGRSLRSGVEASALQAYDSAESVLLKVLAKKGVDIPAYRAGLREQAKQGIAAVLAKAANGIPLSRAVYRTQALATGLVNRKVQQGLLLGMNAKAIAKSVKDLIRPDVKGGVSYAAHRLARTEINHAYKTAQEARHEDEPWTKGMKWNLSKSHPAPDICNTLATQKTALGKGIYPVGQRPDSHPNCLCYLTPEQVDEDEFINRFVAGEYNVYLDQHIYTHAPRGSTPCP